MWGSPLFVAAATTRRGKQSFLWLQELGEASSLFRGSGKRGKPRMKAMREVQAGMWGILIRSAAGEGAGECSSIDIIERASHREPKS